MRSRAFVLAAAWLVRWSAVAELLPRAGWQTACRGRELLLQEFGIALRADPHNASNATCEAGALCTFWLVGSARAPAAPPAKALRARTAAAIDFGAARNPSSPSCRARDQRGFGAADVRVLARLESADAIVHAASGDADNDDAGARRGKRARDALALRFRAPLAGSYLLHVELGWVDDAARDATSGESCAYYVGGSEPRCASGQKCKTPRASARCVAAARVDGSPFHVTITEPAAARARRAIPAVPPPRCGARGAPAGPTGGYWLKFASEAECERVRDDRARVPPTLLGDFCHAAVQFPEKFPRRRDAWVPTGCALEHFSRARARDCLARRNVTRLYLIGDSVVRNLFHGLEALLGADGANAKPPSDRRALAQRPPAHIARLQQHLQPPPRHRAGVSPLPPPTRAGGAAAPRPPAISARASLLDGAATLDYTEIWDESNKKMAHQLRTALAAPPPDRGSRFRSVLVVANAGVMHYVGSLQAPDEWARERLATLEDAVALAAGASALRVWYGATAITALRKPRYSRGRALALDRAARRALAPWGWRAVDNDAITAARYADATIDGLHYGKLSTIQAAALLSQVCADDADA